MGQHVIDLIGQKFGRLLVISRVENKGEDTIWLCKCDCGNIKEIRRRQLISGDTISCGCYHKEDISKRNLKHGRSNSKLYRRYIGIKNRCYYKNHKMYSRYGGRGIKMCDDWKNDFQSFYNWCLKTGYNENLTIDRIDNDGDYSPDNCRWVNRKNQFNNKITTRNKDGTFSKL